MKEVCFTYSERRRTAITNIILNTGPRRGETALIMLAEQAMETRVMVTVSCLRTLLVGPRRFSCQRNVEMSLGTTTCTST
jgi:hypothetical protein